MQVSDVERIILANQYKILARLYPDSAKKYTQFKKIVEGGFETEYPRLRAGFADDSDPESCQEVANILEMFRALDIASKSLGDLSDLKTHRMKFQGFDGHHEGPQLDYVRHVMKQGRWEESNREDLDSHRLMLPRYRRMLERWQSCPEPWELTKEDVAYIVAAWERSVSS